MDGTVRQTGSNMCAVRKPAFLSDKIITDTLQARHGPRGDFPLLWKHENIVKSVSQNQIYKQSIRMT